MKYNIVLKDKIIIKLEKDRLISSNKALKDANNKILNNNK